MGATAGIGAIIDALRSEGGVARVDRVAQRTERSNRAVREQARRAGLWQPFPAVLGLPRSRASSHDLALAAALQHQGRTGQPARDLVAVTRRSALALLGVQSSAPSRVELVVPATQSPRLAPGCLVLRSRHLDVPEVQRHDGVPIVVGSALVRDLASVRTLERLRADVIDLHRIGYVDLPGIEVMLERCRRFEGRARIRQLVAELARAGRVDSPVELEARRRFEAAGIILDRGQICVPRPAGFPGTWRMHLDLGIAALRFGIEIDSFAYHSSPAALRRDAERANRVAALADDWRVLRMTWSDLREGWEGFVALTSRVIAAQAARFGLGAREQAGDRGSGPELQGGSCGCRA